MPHQNILNSEKTALVVVDLQEAFRHPINEFAEIAARASLAVRGFLTLDLPVVITEQYPKGLGRTAEEIMLSLPDDFEFFEKTSFSSCGAATFVERLDALGTEHVVLCGLETHICVNQTAHDLLDRGFSVHLLIDAVASRFTVDKQTAIDKMKLSGVVPATVEMTLFEVMRDSKHRKFKEIQELIK
ncbi:MAG: isochorismatase family protein [Pyrinomonadaceae bacterium]|nr:isochorismatase family protein [Pyrinomonadaceae bacterium]